MAGLQSGQLEMYGVALADLLDIAAQADPAAQKKLLPDERLQESETVLPIIASMAVPL